MSIVLFIQGVFVGAALMSVLGTWLDIRDDRRNRETK